MADKKITVVGSFIYDMIFSLGRLPHKGETYMADQVTHASGGKGANQAVQCAKLGAQTYMVGKLGEDYFGQFMRGTLRGYGVDTRYVGRTDQVGTGIAAVLGLPDGSIHAAIVPGSNMALTKEDIDAAADVIWSSDIVIFQMEIPMPVNEYAIEMAHDAGACVILNAAPAARMKPEVLKMVDYLVVNEVEAGFFSGADIHTVDDAARHAPKLLLMCGGTLIITLGRNGSLLCRRDGTFRHFAPSGAVKVVETTGAGDSYIGAFAVKKLADCSDEDACAFATLVAERTISAPGAQPSMPTLREMEKG
ncbi:MAG: ribokinase [Christensenellales bacterium]|jgi:ribokinase